MEGSGRGVMKVLSRRLPVVTKENHGNSGYTVTGQYLNAEPPKCEAVHMFAVKVPQGHDTRSVHRAHSSEVTRKPHR